MANPEVANKPDYQFGSGPVIQVERFQMYGNGKVGSEPHTMTTLTGDYWDMHVPVWNTPEFQTAYDEKLDEIRDNLQLIADPETGKTFEITIVNKHLLDAERDEDDPAPIMVQLSTQGSTIPDNPSNAVELAQNAIANPNMAIVYVASPGNGGSAALTPEELATATKDGVLVTKSAGFDWQSKPVDKYKAFPTYEALARALETLGGRGVKYLTADDSGAHHMSALMAALPGSTVEGVYAYNPTNISDAPFLTYQLRKLKSILTQGKYDAAAEPLAANSDSREYAIEKMGGEGFGSKATNLRTGTFGPRKMTNEAQIYRRGMDSGNAAELHLAAGLARHPDARVGYGLPVFSPNYTDRPDIVRFARDAIVLGAGATGLSKVKVDLLPVGQYWHSKHPLARIAMQYDTFNR